jgi:hypothetical protein
MNIDKNNITKPKQLIGGERRDKGILQIFYQSSEEKSLPTYATGLNGTYQFTILGLNVITDGDAANEYAVEMISDTFFVDKGAGQNTEAGGANANFKFFHRNGCPEIPIPIKLRQVDVRNHITLNFSKLGVIGANLSDVNYNILLTIEYEKL